MHGGVRTRRGVLVRVIAGAALVALSACSSGDDDAGESGDADGAVVADTTSPAGDDAPADEPADAAEPAVESDAATTEPEAEPGADVEADAAPAQLQALLADAQALCDALDQDEIRSIVGDFVELRPDDLFQEDRNLCQVYGDRFAIAGVWVFADRSEQESLNEIVPQPFSECEVGGYESLCQTHTGNPESFNGWPTVMVGVGTMAVEVDTPDPAVAQQLAAAVLDDLGAP